MVGALERLQEAEGVINPLQLEEHL